MDRASLSPPTTPGITTEYVDRLLEAAKAALRYLDDLDRHAPEGFHFGNETNVRRQLRRSINRADR